jgi:hypothetical protein
MTPTEYYTALAATQPTIWIGLAQWGVWGLVGVLVTTLLIKAARTR